METLSPLEEGAVPLTTEPSLQPLSLILLCFLLAQGASQCRALPNVQGLLCSAAKGKKYEWD